MAADIVLGNTSCFKKFIIYSCIVELPILKQIFTMSDTPSVF